VSNDSVGAIDGHSTEHSDVHRESAEELLDNPRVPRPFTPEDKEIPESANEALSSRLRLLVFARNHAVIFLMAILLFAAADAWSALSGRGIAQFLSVVLAILTGVTAATLVHEWFHYLGAKFSRARITIPKRQGLLVYHWDFGSNSAGQFLTMSIAGSIGGLLAVILVWAIVPADTLGRAVLCSAAVASFIYSSMIEWPVIRRMRLSGDPLAELSKIDKSLLTRSFVVATLSGIALAVVLMV
jgi:hypothetical protein